MVKVRIKDLPMEANTYFTPKGNSYTFFRGQWLEITDKEDIEYFKNNPRFEVESVAEKVKKAVTKKTKKKR